ncbi:DUF2865 domain-containing protein [Lichenihabitans psoromatis]|uniref:DUF2865 domain-containing protein n=1 Tax=Lichenihabitans psoromatis TaxID=2528642 RepID=UPI00103855C2|nr:DUF2865 domain-containing protein [Lichenihabitans psoromatis]
MATTADHHYDIKSTIVPAWFRGSIPGVECAIGAASELMLLLDNKRTPHAPVFRIRPRRSTTVIASLLLIALAVSSESLGASAQDFDCNRLQAAINASRQNADDAGRGTFDRAAQRQRYEIERTRNYAASIGCDNQQRGFFDDGPPPQCDAINAQIERMQGNLSRIAQSGRDAHPSDEEDGQRAALVARYNASCSTSGNPADLAQQHDSGFYGNEGHNPADLQSTSVNPDDLSGLPLGGDSSEVTQQRSAGKAICVRTCDGGFFPLTASASQDQLSSLDELCKASCPNAEAKLYTTGSSDNLASATGLDGTPYTSLPSAFKFEKTFDPTCSCKPPKQSWVEALANAERLLGNDHHGDVTVTPQMSDQMSKAAPAPQPKGKAARKQKREAAATTDDTKVVIEGQRASQAPTATNASAGIAASPTQAAKVFKEGDGATRTEKGPDGVMRNVRIISP